MEPNRQNPTIVTPPTPAVAPITSMNPTVSVKTPKKVGPIVTTLVIVLILIIAVLYFIASRMNTEAVPSDSPATAMNAPVETPTSVQPVTNKADDPASLQSDLNASTKGLDQQNF